MDHKITDSCNEARDNVKFLYSLEAFCEPLYRCQPPEMMKYIPALLYTVRMIISTSRYYNTNERLTSLLVKVNNSSYNVLIFFNSPVFLQNFNTWRITKF